MRPSASHEGTFGRPGSDPLPNPAIYEIKAAPLRGTASGAPCAGLSLGRLARRARAVPCVMVPLIWSAHWLRRPVKRSFSLRVVRLAAAVLALLVVTSRHAMARHIGSAGLVTATRRLVQDGRDSPTPVDVAGLDASDQHWRFGSRSDHDCCLISSLRGGMLAP